jgi:putative transposase
MSHRQTRELVIEAVLMALWQREERSPIILHSDRECQFTSGEYQRFLKGHNLICSMSAVAGRPWPHWKTENKSGRKRA